MGAPNPCRGDTRRLRLVLQRGPNEAHLSEVQELHTESATSKEGDHRC